MVKLGDICKKVTNINSDFIGEIDYIDISSIDNERKSIVSTQKLDFSEAPSRAKQLVLPGDILISNVRPNLNAVAIIISDKSNTLVASTGYTVIRCNNNAFNRYVFFFCQYSGFVDLLVSQATGASYPAVNASIIKNTIIPLPALEKQHQIAKNLDTLQSIITHRRTQLEKLDLLVKARFVEMFGTPESVIDSSHTIAEVADVQVGIVIKPTRYYADGKNGIRAFRSLNIGSSCIKDDDWVYFTEDAMKETQRTIVHTDDILVVRSGNPGTSCVVPTEYDGCNVIDLIIVHPNKEKVLPEYLCAFTNMPHGMNQINSQQRGAAQKHFNVGMYKKLKLILPSLDEQKQFINFLKQTDKSKATVQKALDEAQLLFDSLMQEYFG